MEEKIIKLLCGIKRPQISELIDYMKSSTYFIDPASAEHHSNFPGGLAIHSYSDLEVACQMRNALKLQIPDDSLIITALTHDFSKIGSYEICTRNVKNEFDSWVCQKYYKNVKTKGGLPHGEKSAFMVNKIIPLKDEEYEAISNHMANWSYGVDRYALGQCYEENPLALLLALADQFSTFQRERTYAPGEIPFV